MATKQQMVKQIIELNNVTGQQLRAQWRQTLMGETGDTLQEILRQLKQEPAVQQQIRQQQIRQQRKPQRKPSKPKAGTKPKAGATKPKKKARKVP